MCKVYDLKTGSLIADTDAPASTPIEEKWPDLTQYAKDLGIAVVDASDADRSRIGIHILNPSAFELDDAIQTAERDLFKNIFVYTTQDAIQA